MYRVVIYNGSEETVIHEPTTDPRDPHLYSCKLVQGSSGEIDSLTFTILPNNPGYEKLFSYTTMIAVIYITDSMVGQQIESAEFTGRVLSVGPQMEESGLIYKQVVCEDRLGYLHDSIQPFRAKATYTVREFLQLLLDNHNAQVEDYKKIYLGEVSFDTSSGNVTKGLNYQTTWDAITDKLLSLGGEIQLYSLNGLLYLDYVTELGTMGEQTIEIAKNMRSFEQDESPTDIITRLIPLGDYKDEQDEEADEYERINIESVNDGKNYLDDEAAQAEYGIIVGIVIWEDVTEPENLLSKGRQWLEDQQVEENITLSAYDLSLIGIEPDQIERYNYYETINPLLGIDRYYRVAKKTTDVINPVDVTFTMGTQGKSLSSTLSGANRNAQDAADASAAINANLTKTVATLIASNAIILYLEAEVASIEDAYIDRATIEALLADYATINYLETYYLDAQYIEANYLSADSAIITDLTAFAANIYTLLGGEGAFGELESIHLTTDNAVIDSAVIAQAVAGTVVAGLLESNIIYTNEITIMSGDGGIIIADETMQFTDADGNVRLQIGQDADGNFTFILYDETGEGIMIDSEGIHASAIPDGLIVNDMVADDAAISGTKLDIASVAECLNADGSLELTAAQVTINDTTLDAWYTSVTQTLEGLEGLTSEGLMNVIPYFCLGDSDTEAPVDGWQEEDIPVTDGMYKWVKWLGIYADGHTEWSVPYCLTDGYLRQETSVLQTELSEVQGQITAKVWMSDITEALDVTVSDLWAELNIWLDGIEIEVGSMSSTIDTLDTQVASLVITVEGIETRVEDISMLGVKNLTAYFCLWTSDTEAPPDDGTLTDAVCGIAVCGITICGLSGLSWTTDEPIAPDGWYVWIKYLLEYNDGHTAWGQAYCLTDGFAREELEAMYSSIEGTYSLITQLSDELTLQVTQINEDLAVQQAQIQILADSITSTVEGIDSELGELRSEIEQFAGSISLTVSGGLGSTAAIIMTVGEQSTQAALDLTNVRQAFADDDTAIIISAGLVQFEAGTLVINSSGLTLDANGNATFSGDLSAATGTFAGKLTACDIESESIWISSTVADLFIQCPMYYSPDFNGGQSTPESGYYPTLEFYARDEGAAWLGLNSYGTAILHATDQIYMRTPSVRVEEDLTVVGNAYLGSDAYCGYDNNNFTTQFVCRNSKRGIALRVTSDSQGGIRETNLNRWLIAYNENDEIYVGNTTDNTYLRGNTITITNATTLSSTLAVTGAVTLSSTLAVTGAVTLSSTLTTTENITCGSASGTSSRNIYCQNAYGGVALRAVSDGQRGLRDTSHDDWMIARSAGDITYVSTNDYPLILRGSEVRLSSTDGASVTSDRRIKDHIEPFGSAIDDLSDKLTPRIFTVKDDPDKKHIGFVVDEVEDAMRSAGYNPDEYSITTHMMDEDGEELGGIYYNAFIPILVYEIQKLRNRVATLERQLN